ncbi:Protein arginine N-methyltransferase 3 [Gaertneriomyces sp. JEL0708]|nr:Protein arginine N-methyltransferase 3 [Gaertneriomyces sp. JEL0708]
MYAGRSSCDDVDVESSIGDAERDLHSEFGDADDTRWDDWEEEHAVEAQCPFCQEMISPPSACFEHTKTAHAFDFHAIKRALKLDFYGSMKLVNYVRTRAEESAAFSADELTATGSSTAWLQGDTYLRPVLDDDSLLYAFEDDEEEDELEHLFISQRQQDAPVTSASLSMEESLRLELAAAEQRAQLAEMRLQELTLAFAQYKDMVREAFLDEPTTPGGKATVRMSPAQNGTTNGNHSDLADDKNQDKEKSDPEWEMDYYFSSYASSVIHESMLKDRVRTESYRDFVYNNKHLLAGKTVLDVGCGTGILSMFCAKAGAEHVYAVDNSTIINKARRIAKENDLSDKITFVQGEIESIQLPVDTVDIIISEWMGYFLLFEGMLDSVLVARDRFLAPDGFLAPSRTTILISAFSDAEFVNDTLHFWNDVYGFKMSCMQNPLYIEGNVDIANPDCLLCEPLIVKDIDILTTTVPKLDFSTPFELTINKAARLHGLIGWFDTYFTTPDETDCNTVFFSTGPHVEPTHWKQTMFLLPSFIDVEEGYTLSGTFATKKSIESKREVVVTVDMTIRDTSGKEIMDVKREYHVR